MVATNVLGSWLASTSWEVGWRRRLGRLGDLDTVMDEEEVAVMKQRGLCRGDEGGW